MEDRESYLKRLNDGIWNLLKRIKLRPLGATILGGCAGLSLVASIIPTVISYVGIMDNFSVRWVIGGYAVYSVMIWSVGGWAAQKIGNKVYSAVTLGFVGLVSGLVFTAAGLGTQTDVLLLGGGAAMLYGAVGGLLIGEALRDVTPSASDKDEEVSAKRIDAKSNPGKKDPLRFFRFFK